MKTNIGKNDDYDNKKSFRKGITLPETLAEI